MPPLLLEALAEEPCEAEALAAEKLPERPPLLPPPELPPARATENPPERGAEGGATEREAAAKLRAGVAVGRALVFATRRVDAEAGEALIAPTRALVAAVEPELTKRCAAAS